MNNFRVGQKVICIDADCPPGCSDLDGLTEKQIYTVRWVGMHSHWRNHIHYGQPANLCIRVVEIVRTAGHPGFEPDLPFRADRFRPLVEKKTDISIFTALLNPANHRVDA